MSQENVERQGLEAFFVGDLERAMSIVHPDVVAVRAPPLPDPQTYHGIEGVLQMYADWTTDFGEFEMAAGEFIDAGDRVVAEIFQRGRGQAGGAVVGGRFWFVFTIADRKTIRYDVFNDTQPSLRSRRAVRVVLWGRAAGSPCQ